MLELSPPEFPSILPLLAGIPQKVLPYAIYEGINPGRAWVDRRQDPHTALLWSKVGYYCLAGEPAAADLTTIQQALTEILIPASLATGENCLILIPSSAAWKEHLPSLLPGREMIEIYRRPFMLDSQRFAALGDWRARIPPGMRLLPVDTALAEQLGVRGSWASVEDFLREGIGFVLLEGGEIASACTSVFASHERVEIDVHTAAKYQRRGLAKITASALIEACLQRGKTPNWECFWDNEPSVALAVKLGFISLPDYAVHFWEEPTSPR
jgi:RimJ/RimL family protein N-acetyltransferase